MGSSKTNENKKEKRDYSPELNNRDGRRLFV